MGQFKGAHITEQRIYADPSNPETSDFEVALLRTVPEAITDTETGKTLRAILTEQANGINDAKSAAETAQKTADTAKSAADDIKTQITEGGGVPASTLGGKTSDDFAAADHTHNASDISDLPTSLPANGGNADTVGGAAVMTTSALGLHRMASGTAAPTSATCPPGCLYAQYE